MSGAREGTSTGRWNVADASHRLCKDNNAVKPSQHPNDPCGKRFAVGGVSGLTPECASFFP